MRITAALCAAILALASCSNLPTSGPSNKEVVTQFTEKENPLGAKLVPLTPAIVAALATRPVSSMSVVDRLRSYRAVDLIGPGDVLSVSIYEAGAGLFNTHQTSPAPDAAAAPPTGSTAETLPRLQVDRSGMIMVPYAGEIQVSGHTTTEVQRMIESRLAQQASQAQVIVTLVNNGSNVVYVSGDVKNSGRYPLSLAHETVLDMIALAGGPTHSPQDTVVRVTRRGQVATTSLTRIQTIPAENIPVEPLDRIQADYIPRSYLAFGATGRVAQVPFDAATVSLAEAVARVGGLDDSRANPEAVFLFRYEDNADANLIGVNPGTQPVASVPRTPGALPAGLPILYQVNMRDPQTYFVMQQFTMRDKDVIYIANAPTVQIYKFLQLLYTLATPAVTARTISQ
jgi:polysaccharide export outer membrane protein